MITAMIAEYFSSALMHYIWLKTDYRDLILSAIENVCVTRF